MGSLFRGEHRYSLDDKGRVVLPPSFRRALGGTVVLTRGLDECVAVYPPAEWAKNERKLRQLPVSRRDFVRFMLSSAEDVELDRQGRISIPQHLREYAKIEREAVVVGLGSRLEIWGLENWKRYIARVQAEAPQLASELKDLSI
ncbi:MAG: division/cell wall cluster transcriptional repressor MraZ [Armatimonadota bacterium]|nr:division/cell wall cluster transcriptional repressor MraZ [Armatimonadota bacterium]MDR7467368.1 division/cell wall cluster transcriptional repressor MraZ [Armatimonadota bacterium]MDR7494138.1 division/cell wall cluster transcriptional repressor MraZ [Armatimonadota bacterium]MDR7498896.1 division/cell wall cluster transcriptional repressor MraZ [Armatimonadota bacterium]MDR7504395.1 division/cell wall cluster transcriptional repressor MraZ [Armatimonadota bacterium]